MEKESYNDETDIKIIIAGLSKVGKSSFLSRWVNNEYSEEQKTSSFSEIGFKKIQIDGDTYNIWLWVVSSNDISTLRVIGKDAKGIIMICDNTKRGYLYEINELKEKLIRASECKYPDTFPCVIVQNKIDLLPKEQQSNDSILKSFAKENGYINAYNVSAKEGINIDKVMDDLINEIIPNKKELSEEEEKQNSIKEEKKPKKPKPGSQKRTDLKLLTIGTSTVGKTSFVNRYTKNIFTERYRQTIVSEFGFKIYEHNSTLYRLQIWDVADHDKNGAITKIFSKNAHGVIIMCDATNKATLDETIKWKKIVDETTRFDDGGFIPSVLVENKIDLLPEEEQNDDSRLEKLQKFAKEHNFDGALRVSAKKGKNIIESVTMLVNEIIRRLEGDSSPVNSIIEKKEIPESNEEVRQTFMIIVRGKSQTGKTSLINKFCNNTYSEQYEKTTSTYMQIKMRSDDKFLYKFQFLELVGDDKDGQMTKAYANKAHGFVIMSDASDPQSMEDAALYKRNVDQYCKFIDGNKIPCIFIENKIDLLTEEDRENDEKFSKFRAENEFDMVFRVSVKDDIQVKRAMDYIMKDIIRRYNEYKEYSK